MKKGEVWRVRLPLGAGHAQAGERPALIFQEGPFIAKLPTVLVIPFTSTMAATRFAGTLVVQPDKQNGLTMPSVALVFQLSALDKRECLMRLGILDQNTLDKIQTVLHQLTGR